MKDRKLYAVIALQVLEVGALVWLLVAWNTPWNATRYMGTVLAVGSISLVGVARFQLGKSFVVKAEAHELVTRGLYSFMPSESYCWLA